MIHRIGRPAVLLAAVAFGISGCGSDKDATAGARLVKSTALQIIKDIRKGDAETARPITRADLAAFNSPMIQAEIPALGLTSYMVPFGQNGDVETWSSADDRTVSFREGIMVATRGFGPDIMQATAPSIAKVSSGSGTYDRVYQYLDGGDQVQNFAYRCTLANAG
ncbi:MAG: YjbF family lipoprotein, partial [Paracoccaceae bacterium]